MTKYKNTKFTRPSWLTVDEENEILVILTQGNKLQAVKKLFDYSNTRNGGFGVKESKEYIDAFEIISNPINKFFRNLFKAQKTSFSSQSIVIPIVLIILFVIVATALITLGAMYLWNALIPELFHGPELSFWQTLGLLCLAKFFFGNIEYKKK
jgi:hypothetical protein